MDWANRYGRTGFHSGIGGDRPFNSPNKPTLDVSKADYDRIKNANVLPDYYSRLNRANDAPKNKKQIVFWNDEYEKPLPQNEQVYGDDDEATPFAASRIRKRNYIKTEIDKKDPVLKFENAMEQYPEEWSTRKQRRDALRNNPFQDMAEDNFPIEPGYGGPRLTPAQVKRSKFREAMLVSRPDPGRSPAYSASSPMRPMPLGPQAQIVAPRAMSVERPQAAQPPRRPAAAPQPAPPSRNQQLNLQQLRRLIPLAREDGRLMSFNNN